jgi:hypothetical protein
VTDVLSSVPLGRRPVRTSAGDLDITMDLVEVQR